jgi:hypothetical protein
MAFIPTLIAAQGTVRLESNLQVYAPQVCDALRAGEDLTRGDSFAYYSYVDTEVYGKIATENYGESACFNFLRDSIRRDIDEDFGTEWCLREEDSGKQAILNGLRQNLRERVLSCNRYYAVEPILHPVTASYYWWNSHWTYFLFGDNFCYAEVRVECRYYFSIQPRIRRRTRNRGWPAKDSPRRQNVTTTRGFGVSKRGWSAGTTIGPKRLTTYLTPCALQPRHRDLSRETA